MFPIDGIREHIAQKLDTEIGVFRKHRDTTLNIEEAEKDERKKKDEETPLLKIEIVNLPNEKVWVFENEFAHQQFPNNLLLDKQKTAFTSAGDKVEKTIIWYDVTLNRFYICMLEMKRTISAKMFSKVKAKYTGALNTFSVFLAANSHFTNIKNAEIYPIGICCFNYLDSGIPERGLDSGSKTLFFQKYIQELCTEFPVKVEPLSLQLLNIPVVFYENPNQTPVSTDFQIDFQTIIRRATNLEVVPTQPTINNITNY